MVKDLNKFKMPRWEDLPPIPLYLDQVLLLIDEWFGGYMSIDDKKIITKTMINNYVKLKFVDAPVNKKYSKASVAKLFVIATLKPVFTIEEITELMKLAINYRDSIGDAYNEFCDLVEEAVSCAFHNKTYERPKNPNDPRNICWSAANALACQLYVRNIYLEQIEKKAEKNTEKNTEKSAQRLIKSNK